MSRLPSRFFHEKNVLYSHCPIDCLAHVVHGQQANADGGKGLNFDACPARRGNCRNKGNARPGSVALEVDGHLAYLQWMA